MKGFLIFIVLFGATRGYSQLPKNIYLIGTNINIRQNSSTKSKVVYKEANEYGKVLYAVLEKGPQQKIGNNTDYWYKIKLNNSDSVGWVFGALTSIAQKYLINQKFDGFYNASWYNEESGDGGGTFIISISADNEVKPYVSFTQYYEWSTEGYTFPMQENILLTIDKLTREFSFILPNFYDRNDNGEDYVKKKNRVVKGVIYGNQLEFYFEDEPEVVYDLMK